MNERIKELAKEAGITTNLDTDYYERDMNKWVDYFSEKLAELIVRECADVCRDQPNTYALKKDRDNCAIAVEQHFGVEE